MATKKAIDATIQLKVGYQNSAVTMCLSHCLESRDINSIEELREFEKNLPQGMKISYFAGFTPIGREDFIYRLGFKAAVKMRT